MNREDTISLFSERHSCRKFTEEDVDVKDIGTITKAGLLAPCGHGIHASHLFVFKKCDSKYQALVKLMQDKIGEDPFYGAPVIILECVDSSSKTPERDGSAVIENMLLAATMLELGSCWIHSPSVVFSGADQALLKNFDIPKEYVCIDAIVVGVEQQEMLWIKS